MRCGAFAVFSCLTFAFGAAGQGSTTACEDLSYQDRNQTDYGPLRVAAVQGNAKDSQGAAIPEACVGVFTETDHKLIAATETDDKGHFELKDIRLGTIVSSQNTRVFRRPTRSSASNIRATRRCSQYKCGLPGWIPAALSS